VVQVTSTIEQKQVRGRSPQNMQPFGEDGPDLFRRFFGGRALSARCRSSRGVAEGNWLGLIVDQNRLYPDQDNHVVERRHPQVRVQLHGDTTNTPPK